MREANGTSRRPWRDPEEKSDPLPAIVQGCRETLAECRFLIEQLSESLYRGDGTAGRSGIGAHARHCLDHYECLFRGVESGLIDYDGRERDERVERDPAEGLAALARVVSRLDELAGLRAELPLCVVQSCNGTGFCLPVPTTLGRELLFLSGHVTHHLALMKLLAESAGHRVDCEVGVAFSTAAFQRSRSTAE